MSAELAQIEQRLSSLEAGLNQVRERLGLAPPGANWVEQVSGSLADIPEDEYQRFLDSCRAARTGGPAGTPQP
jgi:hypothetical protein